MSDELKTNHIIDTLGNIACNFIPGLNITNEIFDFHAKLKEKRVIDFATKLKVEVEKFIASGGKIEKGDILNEHFVDCMESVYRQVSSNSSETKIQYYRNVLLRQLVEPDPDRMFAKHLSYIHQLNDVQILMLQNISKYLQTSGTLHDHFKRLKVYVEMDEKFVNVNAEIPNIECDIQALSKYQDQVNTPPHNQNKNTPSQDECDFYLLELKNIGFIKNLHRGGTLRELMSGSRYQRVMTNPLYVLTEIGKEFIQFIEEYGVINETDR